MIRNWPSVFGLMSLQSAVLAVAKRGDWSSGAFAVVSAVAALLMVVTFIADGGGRS